jgi:hypothetical protein
MRVQRQQTYMLGGLFVGLQVLLLSVAVGRVAESAGAGFVLFIVYQVLWSTVAGVAAVGRSPWRWKTLIAALALDVGFRVYTGINLAINGRMHLTPAAVLLGWMLVDGLWFSYFYRRRAMFGGSRRWHRLERYAPVIVGPDHYEFQSPGSTIITPPPPGAFGLSRRGTILLAIAGVITLLLIYSLIADTWLRHP